jgi:hypothetical protein
VGKDAAKLLVEGKRKGGGFGGGDGKSPRGEKEDPVEDEGFDKSGYGRPPGDILQKQGASGNNSKFNITRTR